MEVDTSKIGRATFRLILYLSLYCTCSIICNRILSDLHLTQYSVYLNVGLLLLFGYLAISAGADVAYWSAKAKYPHSSAVAIRSVIRIVGVGALVVSIAGAIAGGVAGVALGGFLGMVVGFASQNVLGQAMAGLFILLTKPFQIGEVVTVAGEEGTIEGIGLLFTVVKKADGTIVFIPNNMAMNAKIFRKPASSPAG